MIEFEIVDIRALAVAFFMGGALGVMYFGGLWLTLRGLIQKQRSAMLLMLSFLVRLALLLTAFYCILAGGHWDRLLVALIGFIAVRILVMKKLMLKANTQIAQSHTEIPL